MDWLVLIVLADLAQKDVGASFFDLEPSPSSKEQIEPSKPSDFKRFSSL